MSQMERLGVTLARRYSGGGAVLQDMGCTTFSFLHPLLAEPSSSAQQIDLNFSILTSALQNLGFSSASRQGRNDISVDNFKVSGSAFKHRPGEYLLHHGTVLVDSDMSVLAKCLTPSKEKLASKGISSVGARVKNLSELKGQVLTHESVCDALVDRFMLGSGEVEEAVQEKSMLLIGRGDHEAKIVSNRLTSPSSSRAPSPHLLNPTFLHHRSLLSDWDWRFGKTSEFSHRFSKRFEGRGQFEIHVHSEGGRMTACRVFTDSLDVGLPESIERALIGRQWGDCLGVEEQWLKEWLIEEFSG